MPRVGEFTRVWQLVSESGRITDCRLRLANDGTCHVTLVHADVEIATEVYGTLMEARTRTWQMNRGLLERGWSVPSNDSSAG